MVILPIVQKVGEDMPSPHPKLLVMATALMCSGEARGWRGHALLGPAWRATAVGGCSESGCGQRLGSSRHCEELIAADASGWSLVRDLHD